MILSNEDILIYESFETNLPLVVNQKIFGFRFKKYHNKYAFMNIDSPNQMHEKTVYYRLYIYLHLERPSDILKIPNIQIFRAI